MPAESDTETATQRHYARLGNGDSTPIDRGSFLIFLSSKQVLAPQDVSSRHSARSVTAEWTGA